ncbi:hypothetical protein FB567DRAFT_296318 [Paraphoma chrysanthemicola]|uniref:F-box domain-containing protein n=1 Tax=Paraphoma chrysanthemicola TaxID=798071 RepID=A0A8K0W0Q4_9PLEO|nr:hypothetical protein FB567DRAFT_296318 [Paraphoma chrysanthemicola]
MSWNLNLCVDYRDKVFVPFHYFVKPEPQPTLTSTCVRFPFLRLPIDLQLIVFEHCDAPTLFWLMQTCTSTRRSATKLFWENAHANHWYHCADYSLFEHRPGTRTFLQHCPEFAARITNVEIDLIRIEYFFSEDEGVSTATKAKTFWDRLESIFPSVRAVTLTGCNTATTLSASTREIGRRVLHYRNCCAIRTYTYCYICCFCAFSKA